MRARRSSFGICATLYWPLAGLPGFARSEKQRLRADAFTRVMRRMPNALSMQHARHGAHQGSACWRCGARRRARADADRARVVNHVNKAIAEAKMLGGTVPNGAGSPVASRPLAT